MIKSKLSAELLRSGIRAQKTLTLTLLGRRLLNRSRYAAELAQGMHGECGSELREIEKAYAILFKEGDEFDSFGADKLHDNPERVRELESHVRKVNQIIARLELRLGGK